MKLKRISLILVIMFLTFITRVKAYTYSLSSGNTVTVGSTITVTFKYNDVMGKYKIYSSDNTILSGGDEDVIESPDASSRSFVFSAKKVGTVNVYVTPIGQGMNVYSSEAELGSIYATINVVNKSNSGSNGNKPVDINKTYSKDNYLKYLDVVDYDITPKFDKDTLEYKLDLDSDITSIIIKATASDENASIKGAGEVTVSEGTNTINIVVTAENGNERTYKIIANVKDKKPIKVKIGNKNYVVVKKDELLGTKEGYTNKEIEIKGIKVPALYNEATKVTLVGLKDDKGNIKLYLYDTKNGKYSVYNEFKFDLMNLYVHKAPKNKYEKTKIKINNTEVVAYKINGVDDYYLLYATNMSTGYEGYYLYDSKENSVQRYNEEMLSKLMQEKDKYFIIVIVLSCVCFLCMAFMLIQLNKGKNEKIN